MLRNFWKDTISESQTIFHDTNSTVKPPKLLIGLFFLILLSVWKENMSSNKMGNKYLSDI